MKQQVNPNYNFIKITYNILQYVSAGIGPHQVMQNKRYKTTWNSRF